MIRRPMIAMALALAGLTSGPANAGQILLGYFDGNDSEAAIESVLSGLGRATDVTLYDKSDDADALTSFDIGDPAGKLAGNFSLVDPQMFVQFLAVKASNRYALYEFTPFQNAGSFSSVGLNNRNGNQHAISHLSFYANANFVPQRPAPLAPASDASNRPAGEAQLVPAPTEVPEPATIGLLGLGVMLVGARRRRS